MSEFTIRMKKRGADVFVYAFLCVGLLTIIVPIYLTLITAFKTSGELIRSFFALPETLYLGNFEYILSKPDYFYALGNSIMITGISLLIMMFILPMLSYPLSRGMKRSKLFNTIYYFVIAGIFVPFQVRMLPLMKIVSALGIMNRIGIILLYVATSTCEGTFLYVGFLSSVPEEVEEAAYIDGASTNQVFWTIIFPLLKPITSTVMIKNGLWIWNDFMLPLLMLNKSAQWHTVTMFTYAFKSAYTTDYSLAFATFVMSMLPIMVLYVFAQRYIIGGLTSGAVKG